MYLEIKNHFDAATETSFYSSWGGHFAGQPVLTGIDDKSSPLRGHILALVQGLKRISDQHGNKFPHRVDVLIADPVIAAQLRSKKAVSSILHGDEDEAWAELFALKAKFGEIRIIGNPMKSEHFVSIWRWSCTPPLPATVPPVEF
jgi:hypothetical protein